MQVTAGEGLTAEGIFTVTESHQGAPGLAHGGLLSAAIDEILASLNWLLGMPAVTGRLECDFRCPVPVGTTLIIQAWVESIHGRKVYTRALAHMNQPSGPLAIEAQALFIQVPLEHFAVHGNRVEIDAGTVNRRKAWTEMTSAAHLPTTDFDLNP